MSYEYSLNEESKNAEYYKGQIFMYEEAHRLAVEAGEDTADLESKLVELKEQYEALGGTYE
jgi:hypothetical protein